MYVATLCVLQAGLNSFFPEIILRVLEEKTISVVKKGVKSNRFGKRLFWSAPLPHFKAVNINGYQTKVCYKINNSNVKDLCKCHSRIRSESFLNFTITVYTNGFPSTDTRPGSFVLAFFMSRIFYSQRL